MKKTELLVFKGEQVLAPAKIVLLFETHTDIIVTACREAASGYKAFLTGDASHLTLDCWFERGNPTDFERFWPLLDRHILRHCRPPRQSAEDGDFASQANPARVGTAHVKDMFFAK
ncbi:hypothetical protein KQH41_00700 [bacterium]|nr:hypothetical protein [bacterium]